jgi:hypothetical protein
MTYDDEWKDPFEEEEEVLPRPPAALERRRRLRRKAQPLVPWWVWASGGLVVVLAIALLWTWALKAMQETQEPPTIAFTPTFTQPPPTATVAPTDTPLPAPPTDTPIPPTPTVADQVAIGAWVKVTGSGDAGLSFRAGPGLENVRLKILTDGAVLKVLDGPREDQGYTWWRLEEYVDGQAGVIGWTIDEFLEPTSPPQ